MKRYEPSTDEGSCEFCGYMSEASEGEYVLYTDAQATMTPTPTAEILKELLQYDPLTGTLTWLERKPHHYLGCKYSPEWMANNYNARFAGKEAFKTIDRYGYRHGTVLGSRQKAHRVCYAIYHGKWPDGQIDHIDGNRLNNCIYNLRDATITENSRNQKLKSSNTSGHIGVSWHKGDKRWRATISENSKKIHLGSFLLLEDAVSSRLDAEIRLGYHENHGRKVA